MQLQTECNYYAEVCLPDTIEVSGGEIVFERHHEGGFLVLPNPYLNLQTVWLESMGKPSLNMHYSKTFY